MSKKLRANPDFKQGILNRRAFLRTTGAAAVTAMAAGTLCAAVSAAEANPPKAAVKLLFNSFLASPTVAAETQITVSGDWQVSVCIARADHPVRAADLVIEPAAQLEVAGQRYDSLPPFQPNASGWRKGAALRGVRTQETTAKGQLVPGSLQLRLGPDADATSLEPGRDYAVDEEWGTFGRLEGGRLREGQSVFASYRHGLSRLDSVILERDGRIVLRPGQPHVTAPLPPPIAAGETRLANVWVPGRLSRLNDDCLFPILEDAYSEPPATVPTPAEKLLPRTSDKLRNGKRLRILAWGDSVTDASYLPDGERDRWQSQFVERLRQRFPQARIELITEAWGGRNTASYLAEGPGSPHNYREKVLGAKPDLVVSEFVNDAGLSPAQVEQRYSQLLADFNAIGAEWIILTPHYVRPDWMGLARERMIDDDPRPYVAGLREFADRHHVALGDASQRWGRLWRQGLPYTTLLLNAINHPDARGMKLFADSLIALF